MPRSTTEPRPATGRTGARTSRDLLTLRAATSRLNLSTLRGTTSRPTQPPRMATPATELAGRTAPAGATAEPTRARATAGRTRATAEPSRRSAGTSDAFRP